MQNQTSMEAPSENHYVGLEEILHQALTHAKAQGQSGLDWEAQRPCEIGRNLSPDYEFGMAIEAIYQAAEAVRTNRCPREHVYMAINFACAALIVSQG